MSESSNKSVQEDDIDPYQPSYPDDTDENLMQADQEEKKRLINQILELQHTLEDLAARVDVVKEENLKLRSENQILGQYIENMMANSSVFQSTSPPSRAESRKKPLSSK